MELQVNEDGYSYFKRKREPFGDLGNVNIDEDVFPEDLKNRDGYLEESYVDKYGYNFVECAKQALDDNYRRMREQRVLIRPTELLKMATKDAVTRCGAKEKDVEDFLFDTHFASQNMHTDEELRRRVYAEKKLKAARKAKQYKKIKLDSRYREIYDDDEMLDGATMEPLWGRDIVKYRENLNATYYNTSEDSESSEDSDESEDSEKEMGRVEESFRDITVKDDLDTTNPDNAEPPTNDLFFDDPFDSPFEIDFNPEEFLDKDLGNNDEDLEDDIPLSQNNNPSRNAYFFPPNNEDLDDELEGLLTQPNHDRVN